MSRDPRPSGLAGLRQAFDEVRFGPERTLNLRETLPTGDAAAARVDAWLRQRQIDRADEVLIITGRGNQRHDGVSVVREATIRTFHMLRRRGVISAFHEHTAGSFVVELAPVESLWESPRRNRGRGSRSMPTPPSLGELDEETREMLRDLAVRSLESLGVQDTETFIAGEMLRQFGAIAASVGDAPGRDERLRTAIRTALDQSE